MKENQAFGGTSGSDSDSESMFDMDGLCDQGTNPTTDVKRMRRYVRKDAWTLVSELAVNIWK